MRNLLLGLFLVVIQSCQLNDQEEIVPYSSYHWTRSQFSPDTPIFFTLYTQDDNGNLYGYGYQNDVAIFKLNGNEWTTLQEIGGQGIMYSNGSSFTVFNESFYFASFNTLYKLEEGAYKEIFTAPGGRIYDIKTFKGKMLIEGENLSLNGETFSIVNFDGVKFESLSKLEILGRCLELQNEILFAGFPGFIYDGEKMTLNNVYGWIDGVDNMGHIYVIRNELAAYKIMMNVGLNEETQMGKTISLSDDGDHLGGLYNLDNAFVLLGSNTVTSHTLTFVLNNDNWEKVEIKEPLIFRNFFKYDGRILGSTEKGELMELVKE